MAKRVARETLENMVKKCQGKISVNETAKLLGVSPSTVYVVRRRLGISSGRAYYIPGQLGKTRAYRSVKNGGVRAFWLSKEAHMAFKKWCHDQGVSMSDYLETWIRENCMPKPDWRDE